MIPPTSKNTALSKAVSICCLSILIGWLVLRVEAIGMKPKMDRPLMESHATIPLFTEVSGLVGDCLVQSDRKRQLGNDGASTGWTSWADEDAVDQVQTLLDSFVLNTKASDKTPKSQWISRVV